ncbi:hypothetical protein PN498_10035 [Oscillatoria sp. CS-180]|uniref:hypothetical protein n=1 Tax=Oscillatoria sp. CS-180 TaxID=3021720 RepID=UPI00232D41A8|nr:hypothetical protein [Oscillatoria sp. CS-180]MDB9526325.1 hypothetical protein [Oscillatoria sp. CS-180]
MNELLTLAAADLVRAIANRKISSEEVVTAYLQRIEAVNPRLNAIVQLAADSALLNVSDCVPTLTEGAYINAWHSLERCET